MRIHISLSLSLNYFHHFLLPDESKTIRPKLPSVAVKTSSKDETNHNYSHTRNRVAFFIFEFCCETRKDRSTFFLIVKSGAKRFSFPLYKKSLTRDSTIYRWSPRSIGSFATASTMSSCIKEKKNNSPDTGESREIKRPNIRALSVNYRYLTHFFVFFFV